MKTAERIFTQRRQNARVGEKVFPLSDTEKALCWEIDKLIAQVETLGRRVHALESKGEAA